MDFSTISRRIEDNHYTAMEQFEHDFNLIISNCLRYNAPDTIYYRAALKLRDQGRPIVRAARRQVERAGIDPVTGLHTEEPPTLADREPTEEGELPTTILVLFVMMQYCYIEKWECLLEAGEVGRLEIPRLGVQVPLWPPS